MKSKINDFYIQNSNERICQGDIFRDIEIKIIPFLDAEEGIEIIIPYVVVLTQDCDLESDYNNRNSVKENQDKYIDNILISPAYIAEKFREGEHLPNTRMERKNSDLWREIKNNNNKRYHYLPNNISYQIPELVIDFKHYFTVYRDYLYKIKVGKYLGSINELFREDLSQRFSYYLSRIGLPKLS